MSLTGPGPEFSSKSASTFSIDDLETAIAKFRRIEFVERIRDAEKVEVKATPFADRENIYAFDASGIVVGDPVLYVVCHPDREDEVREAVAGFRRGEV